MSKMSGILDLTSKEFDVDAYLSKMLKEKTLDELVKEEENMVNCVRRLDSDVHQIVYENYNKFLTATNTVRKIENEFNQLDSEMASLKSSMASISSLVADLSDVLGGGSRKAGVSSLAASARAVAGVQCIFELPATLQTMLEEKRYADLVNLYLLAEKSLAKYKDMDSVEEIVAKSKEIMKTVERELEARVSASAESVEAAGEALSLLARLGTPSGQLQIALLDAADRTLTEDLASLSVARPLDVLELVDGACSTFLPNLALCAQLHRSHFPNEEEKLLARLKPLLCQLHEHIRSALLSARPHDTALVVRALDRYFRKCGSVSQMLPKLSNTEACMELVEAVSAREVDLCREKRLEPLFPLPVVSKCSSAIQVERERLLDGVAPSPQIVQSLLSDFLLQVKTALAHLLLFTASDVAFSSPSFHLRFACLVHAQVVVGASTDSAAAAVRVACGAAAQPELALVLALFAHQMAGRTGQLQVLCREQFALSEETLSTSESSGFASSISGSVDTIIPSEEEVSERWRTASQTLLRNYTQQTALAIGDRWCNSLIASSSTNISEPRGVSVWTIRVRDELRSASETIDNLCGENEKRKPPGSSNNLAAGMAGGGGLKDKKPSSSAHLAISDLGETSLWSERVDLHAAIHFNKQSIMTSMMKRVLKSGVEGVRLRTLATAGVQQVQVDVAFLSEGVSWLTGGDAAAPLLSSLFDQLLSAALRRCSSPQLLHPGVVTRLVATANQEIITLSS